eukprot:1156737-Pelagomonas_calceolata.AAC.3
MFYLLQHAAAALALLPSQPLQTIMLQDVTNTKGCISQLLPYSHYVQLLPYYRSLCFPDCFIPNTCNCSLTAALFAFQAAYPHVQLLPCALFIFQTASCSSYWQSSRLFNSSPAFVARPSRRPPQFFFNSSSPSKPFRLQLAANTKTYPPLFWYELQDVPNTKGFSSQLASPESAARSFEGLALIEFAGCPPSSRMKLPVKGRGMACGFAASPMVRLILQ